ncbi:8-amino-7-oxononanoate synthase [Sulfurovum lithotrophicum]|uniref:8-amino-7-oxononanoate synthase n=1 Tax=Sulfurovum lithotrophicum TaxID=206403 RepID=A0A7U4RRA3_9BACT|nr:pyridoxal phosphate-dependent aminotransferase family protein [Sulfurovum lithotrophicum]AKF25571.1 8-amino-7-oxononanoate synthase [Sulfurovum lithotrophicum]
MYENELKALKKAGRFRERKLFNEDLTDLASNDYLGLAEDKGQLKKLCTLMDEYDIFAPRASMLVNGYHPVHRYFEETLSTLNGFESGLVVGSGFLANMSLVEALVRKHDMLFMDEEYHASGMMATGLLKDRVVFFRHNDAGDLREKMSHYPAKRQIIAVEGVYSMSGEVCSREVFDIAGENSALLIIDEAHSSGVLGKNLLGVFEHYGIEISPNHIKMGTLGKAYGSYGAYILAGREIISFLENRAKPVIYSTAPSVLDTALALINIKTVSKKAARYRVKIDARLRIVEEVLGIKSESLIIPIPVKNNKEALRLQKTLMDKGFLVGAIRQPTVASPILRVIPRLGVSKKCLKKALQLISDTSLQSFNN